jgi:hypothetical protein
VGCKDPPWDVDAAVVRKIARYLGLRVLETTRREVAELAEQYPVPAAKMDEVVA